MKIRSHSIANDLWALHHDNAFGVLRVAFGWCELDEYLTTLWEWLQAALGNDNSAYESAPRRIDLMKYYNSVIPLIEALNTLNEANKHKMLTEDQEKSLLTKLDMPAQCKITIERFCNSFTWDYSKMELWDWYDAGNSNNQYYNQGTDRSLLLLTCQCVYSLLKASYLIHANYKEPQQ